MASFLCNIQYVYVKLVFSHFVCKLQVK